MDISFLFIFNCSQRVLNLSHCQEEKGFPNNSCHIFNEGDIQEKIMWGIKVRACVRRCVLMHVRVCVFTRVCVYVCNGLICYGFYVSWHINLRLLFNAGAIPGEDLEPYFKW